MKCFFYKVLQNYLAMIAKYRSHSTCSYYHVENLLECVLNGVCPLTSMKFSYGLSNNQVFRKQSLVGKMIIKIF